MHKSKWLLLLLIPMLFGFDTRNPFRTRGPFKAYDFTIGSVGGGGGCTDGVDCFCDTAPANIFCEDFENASLYEPGSANPWHKSPSGNSPYRGGDSFWTNTYGSTGAAWWSNGTPASPYLGSTCGYSVCGLKEYCSAAQGEGQNDCFGPGTNTSTAIDIQRAGDFNAQVGTLTLIGGSGDSADVGSGNTHYAARTPPGNTVGIHGYANWSGGNYTTIGMTKAHAYSSNMASISLCDDPWKHDEFEGSTSDPGGYYENFGVGNTGRRGYDGTSCGGGFPYSPIMFHAGSESACDAAVAAATISVGEADCNSQALRIGPGSGVYTQSTDFPFGSWACMQAYITGMGTSNLTYQIWHNETLIFSMTNFDGTVLKNTNYRGFFFNNYSNANQGSGEDPNTADGYRYADNIIIVNSSPVACSAIGF